MTTLIIISLLSFTGLCHAAIGHRTALADHREMDADMLKIVAFVYVAIIGLVLVVLAGRFL